jgi:uncharacterized protein
MSDFSVGICVIQLHIPHSQSLKSKRSVVKSLKEKIKNQYPVSIAEVGNLELWQKVELALAQVNNSSSLISNTFEKIIKFIESHHEINLIDYKVEML